MASRGKPKTILRSMEDLFNKVSPNGLTPPQAIEVEESILGAMMVDRVAAQTVIEVLRRPDDDEASPFYREANHHIYRAMWQLDERHERIDQLSVSKELRAMGKLEDIGGPARLVELTGRIVTTANVEAHSRMLIELSLARELIRTCEQIKLRAFLGEDDTFELLDEAEGDLFKMSSVRHRKIGLKTAETLTDETEAYVKAIGDRGKTVTGVSTGLADLDEMTLGFQKSEMTIIGARPSMGKTALALHFALAAALGSGVPTAFFSLEMGDVSLMLRMICSEANIPLMAARKGIMKPEEWARFHQAKARIRKANIFVDETSAITPAEIRSKVRRYKQKEDIGLVVVDYLQLMELGKPTNSREQEISSISRSLKNIAKECEVPMIVLCQLSREVERRPDKRPMLSDLRESGAIEQDADLVFFLYRPEWYGIEKFTDGKSTENVAEIIVAKHRNGPVGYVRTKFNKQTGEFDNLIDFPDFFDG